MDRQFLADFVQRRLTEVSLEKSPARARGFRFGRRGGADAEAPQPTMLATQTLPENVTSIELKIEGDGPVTRTFYKVANGEFTQLGDSLDSTFLSTDTAGGFQGVTLGMFAHD